MESGLAEEAKEAGRAEAAGDWESCGLWRGTRGGAEVGASRMLDTAAPCADAVRV